MSAPLDFEALRESLPVDDPDRHALDTVADESFARLAPGYPDTSNPQDFAASVAANLVQLPDWGEAPVSAGRPVADTPTGGAL
ncbi:MAG: hypothetical protein HOW97_34085 [Catenulispora sp.]|nr:hypothetical protein [Catenulispora sp.]